VLRTSHFRIVSDGGSPAAPAVGVVLETLFTRLSQEMARRGLALRAMPESLLWMCFDDQDQYCRYALDVEQADRFFPEAYYSTRTHRVALLCRQSPEAGRGAEEPTASGSSSHPKVIELGPLSGGVSCPAGSAERIRMLTHELTHQVAYAGGLQKRGVMYPLWVSEGLATFFEGCALAGVERDAGRKRRLIELACRDRLMPLDELAALAGSRVLRSSPADVYAQCWGLFAFLLAHSPDGLSSYLADSAQLPVGRRSSAAMRRSFVAHFGRIDTLEHQWREFIVSLAGRQARNDSAVPVESGS